jgi:hypothetical protein
VFFKKVFTFAFLLAIVASLAVSQEPKPPQAAEDQKQTKAPVFVPPSVRLKQAKSVFMKNGGGSDIPFSVIESGVEGWGKYTLVDSAEKADLIVEVTSPTEDTGVSVTSRTTTDERGREQQSTTSSKELTVEQIKLVVYDAKNKVPLWSATEKPKGGFKQKTREDNLVEASQKLVREFRERVEPPSAQ